MTQTTSETIKAELFTVGGRLTMEGTPHEVLLKSMQMPTLHRIEVTWAGMTTVTDDGVNFTGTMPPDDINGIRPAFFKLWYRTQVKGGRFLKGELT